MKDMFEDMPLTSLIFFSPKIKKWCEENPRHAWALDQLEFSRRDGYYRTLHRCGFLTGAVMDWLWSEAGRIEELSRSHE
jgi:hypothetical protein